MTDISKINLNLLLALEVLLEQCHVSRAADQLDISQAGMSMALKQLRDLFQDALLVRGQHGRMSLTPLAESLRPKVTEALAQINSVFYGHVEFDPATSKKTFHIGMSDYIAFVLLSKLMHYLSVHAPYVRIIQHAVNYMQSADLFFQDKLDLVIGHFPKAPNTLKTQRLFSDEAVIAADRNHPIFKRKTLKLEHLQPYPQIFVSFEKQPEKNFIYEWLISKNYQVNAALITPHTLVSLQSLPKTPLIAHTVSRLAEYYQPLLRLDMRPAPYHFPKYQAKQYWHIRMHDDPAHRWLRSTIKNLV